MFSVSTEQSADSVSDKCSKTTDDYEKKTQVQIRVHESIPLTMFSSKNSFLPTMPDDHTSEARQWLSRETRTQLYCKCVTSQTQICFHHEESSRTRERLLCVAFRLCQRTSVLCRRGMSWFCVLLGKCSLKEYPAENSKHILCHPIVWQASGCIEVSRLSASNRRHESSSS